MKPKVKSLLRYLRACLCRGTGLLWLAKRRAAKRGIVVLTLHRVLSDDEFSTTSSLPGILVREPTFRRFVSWAARNFQIFDLSDSMPAWDRPITRAQIALTFDDGWFDNHQRAVPAVVKHCAPITIFICPNLMGQAFPFWPEQVSHLVSRLADPSAVYRVFPNLPSAPSASVKEILIEHLKQMEPHSREECILRLQVASNVVTSPAEEISEPLNRTMTWEQAQELRARGINFGSHTLSHPILTLVSLSIALTELVQSRERIEANLNVPCKMLAYPNGNHNDAVCNLASEAGYKWAFTTKPGLWTRNTNPFRIPRINIHEQKLVSPFGRFSPAMAEYSVFWNLKEE